MATPERVTQEGNYAMQRWPLLALVLALFCTAVNAAETELRTVQVVFNTDTAANSALVFKPMLPALPVTVGKQYSVVFIATNTRNQDVVEMATPTIYPMMAARYLRKTACYCFIHTTFAAHETKAMLVEFAVDPALPPEIDKIILSYSFAPAKGS